MPNLLKKIFRPSSEFRRPSGPHDITPSPTQSPASHARPSEIDELTQLAQRVLGKPTQESTRSGSGGKRGKAKKGTSEYLTDQVEDQLRKRVAADAVGIKSIVKKDRKKTGARSRGEKGVVVQPEVRLARWAGDDGQKVMDAIVESLGELTTSKHLPGGIAK